MPAGYDAEVAELFRDLRAASNLAKPTSPSGSARASRSCRRSSRARFMRCRPGPRPAASSIGYGALLNLDIRPLLRRIYAQIEAGIVQLGPKTMPEMPVAAPEPEDADFEVGRPTDRAFWQKQPVAGRFAAAGPERLAAAGAAAATAPWPPAMPQQPPPQQAPWQGYAPQRPASAATARGRNGGQPRACRQQSWPGPRRSSNSRRKRRPDGQAQQRPARLAQQPQARPNSQAQQPQPQQRKAPQEQPQPVAPAAKTKPLKPERAARPSRLAPKMGPRRARRLGGGVRALDRVRRPDQARSAASRSARRARPSARSRRSAEPQGRQAAEPASLATSRLKL